MPYAPNPMTLSGTTRALSAGDSLQDWGARMQHDYDHDQEPTAEPSCARVLLPAGEVTRAGLVVIGLGLATYVVWHIHEVIFLLFLGILLATAIEPIVDRLR
jgi:hypothetical protein